MEMDEQRIINGGEDEEAGISFAGLIRFVRLAAVRAGIYLLCALIAAAMLLGGLQLFLPGQTMTVARIGYLYDGIDRGLTPDGGIFNKEEIKSAGVVQRAVAQANLQNKITDTESLRSNISVEGVLPQEYIDLQKRAQEGDEKAQERLMDYLIFSTRFDVKINGTKDLGLTAAEGEKLLTAVISEYREYFKQYWIQRQFGLDYYDIYTSANAQFYDYSDFYDLYLSQFGGIDTRLSDLGDSDAIYRSPRTNKTFSELLADMRFITTKYYEYSALAANLGTSKYLDQLIISLQENIDQISIEITKLVADQANLQNQIAAYKPVTVIIPSDNGGPPLTYEIYPEGYETLIKELTAVNYMLTSKTMQFDIYNDRMTKYKNSTNPGNDHDKEEALANERADADKKLAFVSVEAKAFVEKVNLTLEDYYNYKIGSESIKVLQTAATVTIRNIPTVYIIIGFGLAGIIVALIVTQVKRQALFQKKSGKAKGI